MDTYGVVALAREESPGDLRVALRPKEVRELSQLFPSIEFWVEQGAGERLGYLDDEYVRSGANIRSESEVWAGSNLVVKYKSPTISQMALAGPSVEAITGILHPEDNDEVIDWALQNSIKAYSLEYYSDTQGIRPISAVTGRITGELAFHYGAHHLQSHLGGAGILAYGQRAIPTEVLVIGHGNVGGAATAAAVRAGCRVTVAGRSIGRAQEFLSRSAIPALPIESIGPAFDSTIASTDLVIGAILVSTFDTSPIIRREHIRTMKAGSVIVDATAGYGAGYVESMPDPIPNGLAVVAGVVHVKIDRYPALVPRTTVEEVAPQFASAVANVIQGDRSTALITTGGRVVNEEVIRHRNHRGKHLWMLA